jgi:hypothetical protein
MQSPYISTMAVLFQALLRKKRVDMVSKYPSSDTREIAQSMVEFAVSAILILLLLVGIADFGRAFFTYLTLRDAAQEGAVYASVCPIHLDGIQTRIRSASTRPVDLITANRVGSGSSEVQWDCHYIFDNTGPEGKPDGVIDEHDEPFFPACSSQYSPAPSYLPVPGHGVRIQVIYPNFVVTTPLLGSIIGQSLSLRAEVTDTILLPATPSDEACP